MSRLSLPQAAVLPLELQRELSQLDWRLRWVSFVKGCGSLLVTVLILAALFLGIDLFFPLPGLVRFACLTLLAMTALWLGHRWMFIPLTRKRHWPELAYLIDRSFPELQERVSSTVELSLLAEHQKGLASEFMWERLQRETDKRLSGLDLWECLSLNSMARALFAGLILAVLAAAPLLFFSGGYSLLWQRLLTPWQNLDSATNLTFIVDQGDRLIPRGDDLSIQARPEWRYAAGTLPREIRLHWQSSDGERLSREMAFDSRRGMYIGKIPQVMAPLTYHLSSRGAHSRQYNVTVADRPRILDVQLTVIPPAYTQQEKSVYEGAMGTIRAIEGSVLQARLSFEYPVTQVTWNWSTARRAISASEKTSPTDSSETPAKTSETATVQPTVISGQLAADGLSAVITATADQSDMFRFDALSADNLHNQGEPSRMIQVIADRAPRIDVSGSNEPLKIRPDEIIPVELLADDDFGVTEMQLILEHLSSGKENPVLLEWSSSATGPAARQVHDRHEINLGPLQLKNGDILGYRAVARDGRPVPRPNETWTTRRVLLINTDVLSLSGQEVEDFYERMRRQADLVRSEVTSHRKQIEQQRSELDPKPRDEAKQVLLENKAEWLQNKLALSLQLDDLANQLQERPMTAALSQLNALPAQQRIDKTAQQLEKFAENAKQDPLEQIRTDEAEVREAENLLNRLVNQLRDAERIEQELARLEQLARRSRELAAQAAELNQPARPNSPADSNSTTQPESSPEQPGPSPLEKLQQEYSALTHDLDELLKQRPELKQAAKNALLSELSDISTQAQSLAESQQQLTSALQNAQQNHTAEEHAVTALLQEAQQLAQQLASASEQSAQKNAAAVFNADSTDSAVQEQQLANEGNTTRSLQKTREALSRFQESQQTAALPADTQQAARDLAEKSRQLAQQAQQFQQKQQEFTEQERKIRQQAQRDKLPVSAADQQAFAEQKTQLEQQQEMLAEQLAGLMQAADSLPVSPQQKSTAQEVLQRLEQSVNELAKTSDRADDQLKEAASALERLAKNLGTPEERATKAEQQLQPLLKQTAEMTEKLTQLSQQSEKPANAQTEALAAQQSDLLRQLLQQDALGQEEKLAAAVKSVTKTQQALADSQFPEAAQSQQKLTQQLQKLSQSIPSAEQTTPAAQQPQQQEKIWQDVPLTDQQKKPRLPANSASIRQQTERQLQEIASGLQKLQEKTNQALAEHSAPTQQKALTDKLNQLAGEQKQLAEQTAQLPKSAATLPQMQAQRSLRQATEALQMGDAFQAQKLQRQSARQLEQARQQLKPQPDASTSETQELAAALEEKLTALDKQLTAVSPSSTPEMATQNTAKSAVGQKPTEMPDSSETPSTTTTTAETAPAKPISPAAEKSAADELLATLQMLKESQQRLAEQTQQLAAQAASETPDKKALQENLQKAAEQAQSASQQITSGQFQQAAAQAQQAHSQLEQAQQQATSSPAAQAGIEQATREQKQLMEQLQQMAQNSQASPLQRQQTQQQLQQQAQQLQAALQQIADSARAKPLDDRHQAEQVQKLSQQSQQAQQAMQQSLQESQQGNLQTSSQQSGQAQQQLQSLAEQSAKLSGLKRDTLVPEAVGAETAEASRLLKQAQAALEQARAKAQNQSQQPNAEASPPSGNSPTTPAANSSPSSPAPTTPSGSPAGMPDGAPEKPGPLQQLAQELAQAAQALQQAHEQLQPRTQSSASQEQQATNSASQGQPQESTDANTGTPSAPPGLGPMSGDILRSAIMRDWGQSQEKLETDLTDARRRTIDQEYAPLIQRYFESLALPEQPAP